MAGGSASSREQNFWPGFVDALTNVVLVMVFVVVVFAVTMFGGMLKAAKLHVAEQTKRNTEEIRVQADRTSKEAAEQRERAERLQVEKQQLQAELRALQVASGAAAAARRAPTAQTQPPVVISGHAPVVDVSYALGTTTLEKKLLESLETALGGFSGAKDWEVSLQATMAEPSPSEARRMAFYRIAFLRDHLVARGVVPDRIATVILDAPSTDGRAHVAIRVRKSP